MKSGEDVYGVSYRARATNSNARSWTGCLWRKKLPERKLESVMNAKAGYSTPLLHVAEIEKSISFYELLGFTTIDTDRCNPLGWARLHCEDGSAVMFLRAEDAVIHPHRQ